VASALAGDGYWYDSIDQTDHLSFACCESPTVADNGAIRLVLHPSDASESRNETTML
jgi:hypothetical protein